MINVGYQSTIRKEGKCIELNSNEIYEEIIRRDEDKFNNQEEKDINIKDPEPEVNQQDLENTHFLHLLYPCRSQYRNSFHLC